MLCSSICSSLLYFYFSKKERKYLLEFISNIMYYTSFLVCVCVWEIFLMK